jgi:D-alanine-D-alanine ligase
MNNKETVAVLFGGLSAEHEISIITALQAIHAMDFSRYKMVPVYISTNGKWYTGDALLDKTFYRNFSENIKKVQEVTLLPDPAIGGLTVFPRKGEKIENIPVDIYFLAFHGQYGEDGCVQGLLELADAVYTGCGVIASAVAMHKYLCKMYLQAHGIPVLPAALVRREKAANVLTEVRSQIRKVPGLENFPLFVKPCHLGSSVGLSLATDERTLNAALAKAFKYDDEAIVEPYVEDLLEINVAVLDGDPPIASVVEVPLASSGHTLTYEDKYMRGSKASAETKEGMASLSRIIDPKHLDPVLKQQVSDYAIQGFSLLNCSGVGRFDFMYDRKTECLYFNELNPIPGSLAYYLWEKSHPRLIYTEMIERIFKRAKERKHQKLALQKDIGFKVL